MFARQAFRAAQPIRTVRYLLHLQPSVRSKSNNSQQYRRYATEASAGGSNSLLYGAVAAAVAGGGYYYYTQYPGQAKSAAKDAEAKAKGLVGQAEGSIAKAAFTGGGQGFVSLKLASVENVNHNTKKFRFELPEEDQVSGLHVASALLTKYKGPEMEKPAIRPNTRLSEEGLLRTTYYEDLGPLLMLS
jgi:cytochrome-b5 reductase